MNAYVVAEGKFDAEFLERILPRARMPEFHVSSAGGKSAAISLAKSILASRGIPVAVVLDADTLDPQNVAEQERVYYDLLRAASRKVPFRVFFAVPALEGILFSDPASLSHMLGKQVSPSALHEAEFRPRQVLQHLLGKAGNGAWELELMNRIQPAEAGNLAKHPLMRELTEFIRHPRAWSPESKAA